ncbi:hypothetical protein MPSEU_000232500 [Mayamaea pseudoterrestris]|nr:hypothetical protein MPSEU_000232500 [Mayamaea pseudoterrestris]
MGDFAANFKRPDAGISTVEGLVAGNRATQLEKKRQRDQEEFEAKKQQVVADAASSTINMEDKFAPSRMVAQEETSFKLKTVGLVSAQDFRRLQAEQLLGETTATSSNNDNEAPIETADEQAARETALLKSRRKKTKERKKLMSTLSFADGDEEDEEEQDFGSHETSNGQGNLSFKKDPSVDTSFLPDQQRDNQAIQERQKLELEWKKQQEARRKQPLEIVYSYWDGTGHRRSMQCIQGDTVGSFLDKVRKDCSKEFKELAGLHSDDLLYVKEDLILPHDLTFYDLIATKARGKSGPLFHFDVHDDLRIGALDVRVEKDESHPGKVVERKWYERNKHLFPCTRWEVFDPLKEYGGYKIKDSKQK